MWYVIDIEQQLCALKLLQVEKSKENREKSNKNRKLTNPQKKHYYLLKCGMKTVNYGRVNMWTQKNVWILNKCCFIIEYFIDM